VTFAGRDDTIVGMVSGYTAEQHRRSTRQPLKRAAGRWNLRMRIVLAVFSPLMRIIDSIADNDFYLQAIAADKELRGSGVGALLMDSLEQRANASGAVRLSPTAVPGTHSSGPSARPRGPCAGASHRCVFVLPCANSLLAASWGLWRRLRSAARRLALDAVICGEFASGCRIR
jgi:GNAT superfamily N-acetyltransferase